MTALSPSTRTWQPAEGLPHIESSREPWPAIRCSCGAAVHAESGSALVASEIKTSPARAFVVAHSRCSEVRR